MGLLASRPVAVRSGGSNSQLQRCLPGDLLARHVFAHLRLADLAVLARVCRHLYHATRAALSFASMAMMAERPWMQSLNSEHRAAVVRELLRPSEGAQEVHPSSWLNVGYWERPQTIVVKSSSRPKHVGLLLLSGEASEEQAVVLHLLAPDATLLTDDPAHARRYVETSGMMIASWCTGGGLKDPHTFHRIYCATEQFRGVVWVVKEWEYAKWELDYLHRDMCGVSFAVLIVLVSSIRRDVYPDDETCRSELLNDELRRVPVRFDRVVLSEPGQGRAVLLQGLGWLLQQNVGGGAA